MSVVVQNNIEPLPAPLPDLVSALKISPGCLGTETARTASGKYVIFAWFLDKPSVRIWYFSDTHRNIIARYFPDQELHEPLRYVAEDSGPILVVASFTEETSADLAAALVTTGCVWRNRAGERISN